ncbi:MAG: adenosine kinase [Alphaproteobacteria bacterium]|nr:adenosine kinase [Alphaproteobacteria bacterium]
MSAQNEKYCAVAAGRTFTDIIAHVTHAFLDEHGIPLDAGKAFDAETLQHIRSHLKDAQMAAGGTAANAISIVAALGGKAGFFGKVGRDDVGRFFLDDFDQRGVKLCCDPLAAEGMSATCLCLLTEDGQRSFATHHGCADSYSPGDFAGFDFAAAEFFMIDAELLTRSAAEPVIREAFSAAKGKTRLVVSLHNVNAWLEEGHGERARFIAGMADLVIGNEAEQTSFQKAVPLPHKPGQLVVTTMGARGAEARSQTETVSVPGQKPPVFVSSVGAGDAFTAGLLFGLSRNAGIGESLQLGVRSALAILGEIGARPTRPMDITIGKGN